MKLVQLVLSDRQKQIEGEHMRSVTRVIVERVGSGQGVPAADCSRPRTSRRSPPAPDRRPE
jgi:hypothetical protein